MLFSAGCMSSMSRNQRNIQDFFSVHLPTWEFGHPRPCWQIQRTFAFHLQLFSSFFLLASLTELRSDAYWVPVDTSSKTSGTMGFHNPKYNTWLRMTHEKMAAAPDVRTVRIQNLAVHDSTSNIVRFAQVAVGVALEPLRFFQLCLRLTTKSLCFAH